MHPPVGCHSKRRWLAVLATVTVLAAGALPVNPGEAQSLGRPQVVQWSSVADQTPFKRAFANCPAGTLVTGGGGRVFVSPPPDNGRRAAPPPDDSKDQIALRVSVPSAAMDGWAVTAQAMHPRARGGGAPTWFVTAYAICAAVEPPR